MTRTRWTGRGLTSRPPLSPPTSLPVPWPAVAVLGLFLSLPVAAAASDPIEPPRSPGGAFHYRPDLVLSDALQPFVEEMTPGSDLFPDERVARELIARLDELGAELRKSPDGVEDAAERLLAPSFRGGRLRPIGEVTVRASPALQIHRALRMAPDADLEPRAFARELRALLEDYRQITVAEFVITAMDLEEGQGRASTEVRFDIVGPGREAWRVEQLGTWSMGWQRDASGWRVVEWTAGSHLRSRTDAPPFSEVTTAAFGGNESFRRQLSIAFDDWVARLDGGVARDSNGHHGVSVADVDGDGLDDVYVAQPYAFPNRLYRAREDGSFVDITEESGLGVSEDTQHSVFADLDNDGDQDLVLGIGSGPVLFVNDGSGHFDRRPGAFRFADGLKGAPMSMAVADYDRDGFLDVYLSVYSFHYGAGEGKAGTPTPYYDAVNGPPSALFRNDGQGGFVEVTHEAGLDPSNDRFTFSAAWGDYDGDGWPDLVATNDFGRKNLYRNLGSKEGHVTFEDVAAQAGVEDHAAGMSILWLDYDADGLLDIYGGQMWSDAGLRVTASPDFMPEATPEVRALYHHHANGNSLLRNRGDGTFEDVTLAAGVNMGRWTWSSGALDFDCDGWEDLYAVNGMLTREPRREDLDWFFWGGIVARSPLVEATGTPYDDAWRAMNRFLYERSIASRHRNVFLRSDGEGRFDDVSGAVGLDLDQDGRAFAVLDHDRDGDPDLLVLTVRSGPQLRLFRNDFRDCGATLAVRLVGDPSSPVAGPRDGETFASNRDAIGARVTVETDRLRRTKQVHAGSGFLSQHSKELLFGLGASQRVDRLTVEWPSGRTQAFTDVPLNHRLSIEEGGELRWEPYGATPALSVDATPPKAAPPPSDTWLFEPFPAPDVPLPDLLGEEHSLSGLRGRPAVVLIWASRVPRSQEALLDLDRGAEALAAAGIGSLALALDPPEDLAEVRGAAAGVTRVPVAVATREAALGYAILNRHLFLNRQSLEIPTTLLLDAEGRVVKAYRDRVDVSLILEEASRIEAPPHERLARALPFPGEFYSAPAGRNYVPYGRELLDQGLEAQAVVAFELAARGNPTPASLFRLGNLLVKTGQKTKARLAYERALALQPDLSEASNDLGALLAENGDIEGAIARFREALDATPDYPDALNNLGYALLLQGQGEEARRLYERALALQPDFPEALNNLGLILGQSGELDQAEPYFREALETRPDYAEAANNLALVLVTRGEADEAIRLLEDFLATHPDSEGAYLTLAKVYLSLDRREEGLSVLDRLLERNPDHPLALEMSRQFR
jgi:tetratricopeptide (TPR) repeat protein